MLIIPRRYRGQLKPQGLPRIDRSHSLAVGLVFYGLDLGNGVVVDLVTGRIGAPDAAPPNYTGSNSAFGRANKYLDNTIGAGLSFTSTAAIQAVAPPFAWATGCVQAASPTAAYVRTFGRGANDNASPPFENWAFQANVGGAPTDVRLGWSVNSGTEGNSAVWSGVTTAGFVSLLGQFTSPTNVDFYTQGVKRNSTTSSYTSINSGDPIRFGWSGGPGDLQSFPGFVYYGAFWQRALSPGEALQLHLDPYGFLIYPDMDLPVGKLAAAGAFVPYNPWPQAAPILAT